MIYFIKISKLCSFVGLERLSPDSSWVKIRACPCVQICSNSQLSSRRTSTPFAVSIHRMRIERFSNYVLFPSSQDIGMIQISHTLRIFKI